MALGPSHPLTLRALAHLALLYRDHSYFDESEALFREHLTLTEGLYGHDSEETLSSANDLAILCQVCASLKTCACHV